MPTDLLTTLLGALDADAGRLATLDAYYEGKQPLAWLSPEAKLALGDRLTTMSTGLPRLAVTAVAERLRVAGFRTNGTPDARLSSLWRLSDLDQLAPVLHREALALGRAHAIVWADQSGAPRVTIESARMMAVLRDPATREVVAALKRWETSTTTEVSLFEPDKVTRLTADRIGAVAGFRTVSVIEHNLGTVPVVTFANADRLLDVAGTSEMADLLPLVDALNKTLVDMMTTSEATARPRRWASGVEPLEDPATGELRNPFPETDRMMIAEQAEARFGSLPGADLGAYKAAVDVLHSSIMAVSGLPAHYLGVLSSQPASADALRAAEASLVARAEARQATFGRSWEKVARLMLAIDAGRPVDPFSDVSVMWSDPATRSIAQEADAAVKLYSAGLLPRPFVLARLGYNDADAAAIELEAPEAPEPAPVSGPTPPPTVPSRPQPPAPVVAHKATPTQPAW